jgi:hypothetical protein
MSHFSGVAISPRAVALVLCIVVHAGCSDVSGGAVELSWKLRAATGSTSTFLDCAIDLPGTGQVAQIRLDWDVGGVTGFRQWSCDDDHGATGFELPEGQALLSVSPVCEFDRAADAATYTAPAPEQRTVIAGNTINLGGVELLLEVASCNQKACICQ